MAERNIQGAHVAALPAAACGEIVGWCQGERAAPDIPGTRLFDGGAVLFLAHCDDGIVWGRLDGERWARSSEAYPEVADPPLSALKAPLVQQLRVFSATEEWLVWRLEQRANGASFAGRLLRDGTAAADAWAEPQARRHLLLGDRAARASRGGFTLLADATGSRHAPPLALGQGDTGPLAPEQRPYLHFRNYFEVDAESGCVRVAASRLAAVAAGEGGK